MKNDQMRRAWMALALALVALLGLEAIWDDLPWLPQHLNRTHFLSSEPEALSPSASTDSGPAVAAEEASAVSATVHTSLEDLHRLFADLREHRRSRLRIAYYADSLTEGDILTETLRKDLQQAYGGSGLGFQGVDPRDASFRISLLHRPGKNWERFTFREWRKDHTLPLGINGEAYRLPAGDTSGTLLLSRNGKLPDPWYGRATFYWGPGKLGLDAGGSHFDLNGTGPFNAFVLPLTPSASLNLQISPQQGVWCYGVGLDSAEGVTLDNYSFRGNGGEGLSLVSPELLKAGQASLGYDLVIMSFGINAISHGEKNYHWYRVSMHKTFEHLKQNLPGAKIVVFGVIDQAERVKGDIVSSPSLPYVLAAQEAAAKDSGLCFISLYDAMGGAGVMKSWVEAAPPLANKDYSHPNGRGGAKLAKIIEAALQGPVAPAKGSHAP